MPLLLSTLNRLWSRGEERAAKDIASHALRVVVALLPVAAIVAGSADEIVAVFFGTEFKSGGRALAVLIFGSFALMAIPVASAVFVAIGKPGRTVWLSAPLVPLALAGHGLFVPRYGAIGAAAVTTGVALVGAAWALGCLNHAWQIVPPAATVARSCLISGVAFFAAAMWSAPGLLILVKLPVLAAVCALLFAALGELRSDDLSVGSLLAKERC